LGRAFVLRYVLAPVLKIKLFENKRRCQDTLFWGNRLAAQKVA
jgi:hypothetical protein